VAIPRTTGDTAHVGRDIAGGWLLGMLILRWCTGEPGMSLIYGCAWAGVGLGVGRATVVGNCLWAKITSLSTCRRLASGATLSNSQHGIIGEFRTKHVLRRTS